MRKLFIYISILVCSILSSLNALAQDGVVQLQFTLTEVPGKVILDWTMNLGQTCNGIDITRSTDGINFSVIGNIQGVCGSSSEEVSYFFIDESPVPNQINSYRLTLGNLGPSQTLSVEIINLEGQGVQVRPNPIIDQARVYFDNDRSKGHTFTLFSMNGQTVRKLKTRSDFFEVDATGLAQGIYILRIETEGGIERAKGKLVVGR